MCIAILSTAHPQYRLIIINNRDVCISPVNHLCSPLTTSFKEFLHRPTSRADWWPSPHTHVLSARDLARAVHGTWLGITKQGRIAVLTNYHEDTCEKAIGTCSRGMIVNSWLALPAESDQTTEEFVSQWMSDEGIKSIGGFNLLCGKINEPLAILSNRSSDGVRWVASPMKPGETVALSNTGFEDRSWEKVVAGERLMEEAIAAHLREGEREGEDELIQRLLGVLSVDTLPRLEDGAELEDYIEHLPKSIFVPVIGRKNGDEEEKKKEKETEKEALVQVQQCKDETDHVLPPKADGKPNRAYMQGLYGTQKQTVVFVGYDGRVRYFERTLYEDDGKATEMETRDRSYEFMIEQ